MKYKILSLLIFCFLLMIVNSCVSMTDRTIPFDERNSTEVIGQIQVTFTSWQLFHKINEDRIKETAYPQLLQQARIEYGSGVDVRNIRIVGSFSGHNLWITPLITLGTFFAGGVITDMITGYSGSNAPTAVAFVTGGIGFFFTGNFQRLTVTGDVILSSNLLNDRPPSVRPELAEPQIRIPAPATTTGIGGAIYLASNVLINELPENSRIAVLSVSSNNLDLSAFVVDGLEFRLFSARKFTIVDRTTLDAIRSEQNLQMSGEVSDASAVSIGQLLGASIVITGSVIGIDANQILSVRALDVITGQIVTMARESF